MTYSAAQRALPSEVMRPGATATFVVTWVTILAASGYPLAGFASIIFHLDHTLTSNAFRIGHLLLAIVGVIVIVVQRKSIKFDPLLLLFLILYMIRLQADLLRVDLPTTKSDYLFFVTTVLLPFLGVAAVTGAWNERKAAIAFFGINVVVCLLALFAEYSGIAVGRSITEESGRLGFDNINPITIGHAGASALLGAIVLWRYTNLPQKIMVLAGCAPAVATLILANSRSPYVSLITAIMFLLLVRRHWWMLGAMAAGGIMFWISADLADRLYGSRLITVQDNSSLERFATTRNSINEFMDHPFLGAGHIEPLTQYYPHNLFLDAAMSLGVFGLGLYTWLSVSAAFKSFAAMRSGELLLPLMFWQFFCLAQLSGSFFGSGALFLTMLLLRSRNWLQPAAPAMPTRSRF